MPSCRSCGTNPAHSLTFRFWQHFCFSSFPCGFHFGGLIAPILWETHMLKKLLALALLVSFSGAMAACETTEGFGRDTKHAGQSIENAADRSK